MSTLNMNTKTAINYTFRNSYFKYESAANTPGFQVVSQNHTTFKETGYQFAETMRHLSYIKLPEFQASNLGCLYDLVNSKGTNNVNRELETLAVIMHYTYALLRYETQNAYALHRCVPSPRCYYPTYLYWAPAPESALAGKLYRFHPVLEGFEVVASEDACTTFQQTVPQLEPHFDQGFFLITAKPWDVAFLYGEFAYNLCGLESGHAIAQLQILAQRLQVELSVHTRFIAEPILDVLQVEGMNEEPLALLSYRNLKPEQQRPAFQQAEVVEEINVPQMDRYPHLVDMIAHARLVAADLTKQTPTEQAVASPKQIWPLQPQLEMQRRLKLEDCFYKRSSGLDVYGMVSAPKTLKMETVIGLFDSWASLIQQFAIDAHAGITPDLYVHVQDVQGMQPGLYKLNVAQKGLEVVRAGNLIEAFSKTATFGWDQYNTASFPFTVTFTVDVGQVLEQYGNRGYMNALQEVGRIAHLLCVLVAGCDLIARPVKAFFEAETEQLFGTDQQAFYQVLVGHNKAAQLSFDMD